MAWEYKVLKVPVQGLFKPNVDASSLDQTLDRLGCGDWELVSSVGIQTGNGATIEIVLMLKRRAREAAGTSSGPPPLP
jgi:hypothetical protein